MPAGNLLSLLSKKVATNCFEQPLRQQTDILKPVEVVYGWFCPAYSSVMFQRGTSEGSVSTTTGDRIGSVLARQCFVSVRDQEQEQKRDEDNVN